MIFFWLIIATAAFFMGLSFGKTVAANPEKNRGAKEVEFLQLEKEYENFLNYDGNEQ